MIDVTRVRRGPGAFTAYWFCQAPVFCAYRSGSCTRTWMTSPQAPHFPEPRAIVCLDRQRGHVNTTSLTSARGVGEGTTR